MRLNRRLILLCFALCLCAILLGCLIGEMQGQAQIKANALAAQPQSTPGQRSIQREPSTETQLAIIKERQEQVRADIATHDLRFLKVEETVRLLAMTVDKHEALMADVLNLFRWFMFSAIAAFFSGIFWFLKKALSMPAFWERHKR